MTNESEWRKAIAEQVRRNCTLLPREDGTIPRDDTIRAVADWIENPPSWSEFTAPEEQFQSTPTDEQRRTTALHLAVTLVGTHKGFRIPEESAISAAQTFESYIKGGSAS